mmetsp:Transcript_26105/g.46293  ORF Transcript_26105/g.46293 Transcript_26105/m.46293 type:complete len:116 (-) Transcript_26105:325-672(-)
MRAIRHSGSLRLNGVDNNYARFVRPRKPETNRTKMNENSSINTTCNSKYSPSVQKAGHNPSTTSGIRIRASMRPYCTITLSWVVILPDVNLEFPSSRRRAVKPRFPLLTDTLSAV